MGPYSIGVAYFGARYEHGVPLEETWLGREGSEDFAGLTEQTDRYRPGAARFDVGEAANFILIPMFVAALEQVLEWDVSNVQAYCRALTRDLIRDTSAGEADVQGLEPVGHLFGLPVPDEVDPAALHARLRAQQVFVSVRGRTVRVSPHVYNDREDLEALRRVLTESGVLTAVV